MWWGLAVGIVCNGVWVLTDVIIEQKGLASQSGRMLPVRFMIHIGTIALAAFYLSAIVLLYQRPAWQKVSGLATAGRCIQDYLSRPYLTLTFH